MDAQRTHGGNPASAALRLRHVLLLALLICPVMLVAAASLVDGEGWRGRLVAEIERWSGGRFVHSGNLRLTLAPPGVEADDVTLTGGDLPYLERLEAPRVRIAIAPLDFLVGRIVIRNVELESPKFVFDARKVAAKDAGMRLDASPFHRLGVRNGRAIVRDREGRGHLVSEMSAIGKWNGGDGFGLTGGGVWRGDRIALVVAGGARAEADAGAARFPLSIEIEAPLLTLAADGAAQTGASPRFEGTIALRSASLRGLGAWAGFRFPEGETFGVFSASGPVVVSGATISIDSGAFEMDGASADGALAVNFSGPRPAIDATLAFGRLDLSPYLDREAAMRLDAPLAHHLDADLRLSAQAMVVAGLTASDVAATLNLAEHVLVLDVAEMDVCGGAANGRLKLDLRKSDARLWASGRLNGVDSAACLSHFVESPAVSGRASAAFEIAGAGVDLTGVMASARGVLRARGESGSVGFNLAQVLAEAGGAPASPSELGGRTAFDTASVDCGISDGKALCDSVEIDTALGALTGGATIDFKTRRLSGGVTLEQIAAQPENADAGGSHAFRVAGTWARPALEATQRPAVWQKRPPDLRAAKRQSRLSPRRSWR
jgi:AsmA protein